jgi:glucan phosphoethanolaminetransferase (alkaline phosphatase superfamily)
VHAVFSIVTAHFLNSFVGVPLGLVEPIRWSLSAALAVTITLTHAAVALRACGQQVLENGIGAAFAPEAALAKGRVRAVVVLLGIGVLASVATAHTARMDWDHMAGSTVAYTLWVVSFGCFYGMMRSAPAHRYVRNAAIVAVLLFFRWSNRSVSAAELGEVAAVNGSFQLTRHMPSAAAADDSSFYRFLSGNTNIPTSVRIAPVDIQFSNLRYTPSEKRPHIFVFVIDSLRRDYLSPYNRAVTFTPAIAQFAGESIVFQNAFTRYGGTGLSEPSIWTGALLLHKQYITPFRPMNTLQKMLRAERYQLFLTRDSILRVILDPDPSDIELDPPDSTMNYEFGRSLAELARRIDHRSQAAEPIFAYTQPQDLHISVIRRQGANCSDCDRYRGFYAPYAERVQQIDKALGTFLAFLKARGLYEESIVVLTADHGDSLGEEGRWGHAYTLFPEIVRIPLILHLPAALRQRFVADGTRLAFSTDITPTLYTLLGMKTGPEDMIHGETLFSNSLAAQTPRTGSYLLAASYAPVYGLVTHGGAKYFVADAVNRTTRSFDLRGAQPVTEEMSDSETVDKKKIIRSAVTAIGRYYGLLPEINK